jgi:hypothetical protein
MFVFASRAARRAMARSRACVTPWRLFRVETTNVSAA